MATRGERNQIWGEQEDKESTQLTHSELETKMLVDMYEAGDNLVFDFGSI